MENINRVYGLLIFLLASGLLLNGCSDNSSGSKSTKFQVNLRANPSGGGEVLPPYGAYEPGEKLDITATPSDGFRFKNWSGDYEGTSKEASITVDSAMSITANFVRKEYDLTVDTTGKGTVDENVVKSKSYKGGTKVELTAHAATGWMFDHWEGNLSGSDNPKTIVVDSPKHVTAVFTPTEYELTINAENGAVQQQVIKGKSYKPGTKVKLTANPDKGFVFDHWENDLSGSDNPETITMDGPKTVTAVFTGKKYALNIKTEGNGNGSVNVKPQGTEFQAGTIITLTAKSGNGQQFSEWTGDVAGGSSSQNPLSYVVGTSNNITAVFATASQGKPEGSGTEDDPYLISSFSNLQWVAQNDDSTAIISAFYKQTLDIDASASKTLNDGKGFSVIGNYGHKFSGHYDGGGHEISGLTINNTDSNIGFIGVTNDAVIENLRLTNASVTAGRITGTVIGRSLGSTIVRNVHASGSVNSGDGSGGLVGQAKDQTQIMGSSAAVNVTGTADSRFIGGLTGVLTPSSVVKQSFATGSISGSKVVGGLVGNHKGKVMNSYSTGEVSGKENFVGGLVGANNGEVSTSYSIGKVTTEADPANYKPGGLSGGKYPDKITNSYFNTETSGDGESKGATGLTTSQMQGANAKDNMEGFDFEKIWKTNSGDYPTLRNNPPLSK